MLLLTLSLMRGFSYCAISFPKMVLFQGFSGILFSFCQAHCMSSGESTEVLSVHSFHSDQFHVLVIHVPEFWK